MPATASSSLSRSTMPSFPFKLLTFVRAQVHKQRACHSDTQNMDSLPPPPPPKDVYRFPYDTSTASRDKPLPSRGPSVPFQPRNLPSSSPSPPVKFAHSHFTSPTAMMYEYPRRRNLSEPHETYEYIDAAEEEVQRQARLKREKENARLQQAAEEEQRRKALEAELQYAATLRRKREQQEREAEELKQIQLENRRRVEKEKRMAEAKKLQEWRDQQARRAAQVAMVKAESQKRRDEDRRRRILSSPKANSARYDEIVSGWVTVQSGDSLSSKRRFCSVRSHELKFFKDASTSSQIMETIGTAEIAKVSDNEDDFNGLESLQYAFGLETQDGRSFIVIPETSHQVEDFIAAIIQAAGL
ncbi:hypothetical protein EIP91_010804 [Steccherinum ochraceum]|uniref:PH domain-containing protein n=1 Tax=Steccherinum ochraceum TaxID=92696 RepID=A0A4R0RMY6_9APHY|nr:hypothetical protein EIP91_010804 [Steccherinum ochraceum]